MGAVGIAGVADRTHNGLTCEHGIADVDVQFVTVAVQRNDAFPLRVVAVVNHHIVTVTRRRIAAREDHHTVGSGDNGFAGGVAVGGDIHVLYSYW